MLPSVIGGPGGCGCFGATLVDYILQQPLLLKLKEAPTFGAGAQGWEESPDRTNATVEQVKGDTETTQSL